VLLLLNIADTSLLHRRGKMPVGWSLYLIEGSELSHQKEDVHTESLPQFLFYSEPHYVTACLTLKLTTTDGVKGSAALTVHYTELNTKRV